MEADGLIGGHAQRYLANDRQLEEIMPERQLPSR